MEITIDFAAVRKITTQEYAQARAEISELGVLEAYRRSCNRHDTRLAAAPDAATLACKSGCSWCCHFSVDVRPVEVFNILEYVAQNLSPPEQARVRQEIAANSAVVSTLSDNERVQLNLKCPFLAESRCTIYAARPQTCRNYHATNAAGCQKSFEEPNNLEIDPDFAPQVYQAGGAHVDAFAKAMGDSGYDIAAYELSSALTAAMNNPQATRNAFADKQTTFNSLEGLDVPLEFADLSE